jgi:hypothetical protein
MLRITRCTWSTTAAEKQQAAVIASARKQLQQSAQLRQSHVQICRHLLPAVGSPTATVSTESASSKAPDPMPDNAKAKQRATRGFRKLMHVYFRTTRYRNESGAMVPLYDPDATDAKANIKWSTLMALPVGAVITCRLS